MIKKIIFILAISSMLFSCGKKGDPLYKNSKEINSKINILKKKI